MTTARTPGYSRRYRLGSLERVAAQETGTEPDNPVRRSHTEEVRASAADLTQRPGNGLRESSSAAS